MVLFPVEKMNILKKDQYMNSTGKKEKLTLLLWGRIAVANQYRNIHSNLRTYKHTYCTKVSTINKLSQCIILSFNIQNINGYNGSATLLPGISQACLLIWNMYSRLGLEIINENENRQDYKQIYIERMQHISKITYRESVTVNLKSQEKIVGPCLGKGSIV